MKRYLFLLLFVFLFFSCGKTVYMSVKATDDNSNNIQGKSIAIIPFDVEFSAKRFAIDLRGVTLKINGQEIKLKNKYIVEDQDDYLGEIGIIEVNILKILGVSEEKIKEGAANIIMQGLKNERNYNISFFNGLGEGKSGYISNKELSIDESTWPFTINYIDSEGGGPFEKIDIVGSEEEAKDKGYNLIIKGSIDLSNELAEIIDVPEETLEKYQDWEFEKIPKAGQYYLLLKAYIDFELIDVTTGTVICNEKTKGGYFIDKRDSLDILLPVEKGGDKALQNYFRETDLSELAIDAIDQIIVRFYHLFMPFYVTTTKVVKE